MTINKYSLCLKSAITCSYYVVTQKHPPTPHTCSVLKIREHHLLSHVCRHTIHHCWEVITFGFLKLILAIRPMTDRKLWLMLSICGKLHGSHLHILGFMHTLCLTVFWAQNTVNLATEMVLLHFTEFGSNTGWNIWVILHNQFGLNAL